MDLRFRRRLLLLLLRREVLLLGGLLLLVLLLGLLLLCLLLCLLQMIQLILLQLLLLFRQRPALRRSTGSLLIQMEGLRWHRHGERGAHGRHVGDDAATVAAGLHGGVSGLVLLAVVVDDVETRADGRRDHRLQRGVGHSGAVVGGVRVVLRGGAVPACPRGADGGVVPAGAEVVGLRAFLRQFAAVSDEAEAAEGKQSDEDQEPDDRKDDDDGQILHSPGPGPGTGGGGVCDGGRGQSGYVEDP